MPAKKKVTKKKVAKKPLVKKKPLASAINYNVRNAAARSLQQSRERK